MKRYFLLIALVISSCSKPSTAPTAEAPPYPFVQNLVQASVSYSNVPQSHFYSSYDQSGSTGYDDTGSISSNFTYTFDTTSFKFSGDTITATGIDPRTDHQNAEGGWSAFLIVDQNRGIIDTMSLDYTFEAYAAMGAEQTSSYEITARQIPYQRDSSGSVTATITGATLQKSLATLSSSTFQETRISHQSESYTYFGNLLSNSSVTIQFIP